MAKATPKKAVAVAIKVSQDGSRLVTENNLTLYYFMPQRYDPYHKSGNIPFMADFPFYLKDWIEDWEPLTGDPKIPYGGEDKFGLRKDDFTVAKREGEPKKGQKQIMFRTWYLYTYKGDGPNQINGEVNGVWQKVSPDLIDLTYYRKFVPPGIEEQPGWSGP